MKRLPSIAPLLLVACGAAEPPPAVPDPAAALSAAPVEAPVERPDFPGVITTKVSEVIPAEFQGRLLKVYAHQRQRVKAGEIVAKLDPRDLVTEIGTLKAQESAAGSSTGAAAASARSAENQAKTECRLFDRGFGSRNACRTAQLRAQEARGQIGAASGPAMSARVQRQRIEEQIKKAEHPSPIAGVITIIKSKEGEMLSRGTPIARVFDDSDLTIRFAVPKEHKYLVKIGGRVELSVAGLQQPVWANITQISDEEPPITFSIVEADIDDAKLRPGELEVASQGRVRIADTAAPATTAVPPPPAVTTAPSLTPNPVPAPKPQPQPAGANQ